jgi:drug/metabolite transporter (DMT)-like permease
VSALRTHTDQSSDDVRSWAVFLFLSLIWGSSFLFIAVALDEGIAPLSIVAYRSLFGAILLGAVVLVVGGRVPLDAGLWQRMAVLGFTNIVVPMGLIAWSQQYISSGMAAIINAMVPLFTLLLAVWLLHDERFTRARTAGLGIGFVGVVLLASPSIGAAGDDQDALLALAGMGAVVLASVSYAVAAVYTRRHLTGHPVIRRSDGSHREPRPVEVAFGSTVMGFLIVAALALLLERPEGGLVTVPASGLAWAALLALGLLGTGLAYLLFFRLIESWGATRTTLVTYIIPLVAIVLGFVLLEERLLPIELAGAALIIGGVVLVNANLDRWRAATTPPAPPAGP